MATPTDLQTAPDSDPSCWYGFTPGEAEHVARRQWDRNAALYATARAIAEHLTAAYCDEETLEQAMDEETGEHAVAASLAELWTGGGYGERASTAAYMAGVRVIADSAYGLGRAQCREAFRMTLVRELGLFRGNY